MIIKLKVTEVMMHILSDLVLGEVQQMSQNAKSSTQLEDYLVKTYNKTASLMAKSCRSNECGSQPFKGCGAVMES